MLWLAISLLCALAVVFCLPLKRDRVPQPASAAAGQADVTAATNVALYQDYAAELQADASLTEADRATLLADKARALLADSELPARQASAVAAGLPVWLLGLTPVLLVLGALVIYQQIGTPAARQLAGGRDILAIEPGDAAGQALLRERVAGLRAHLASAPDDANSWYLVGVGELKSGAYAPAVEAFARTHALVGPDANLDLFWLQARFLADGGMLDPTTQEIVQRVLAREPDQPMALELLALTAFRAGEHQQAVSFLNRALSGELRPAQRRSLNAGFAQARERLGAPGGAVDVKLALAAPPPSGSTLFVIARPVGGGMPYAVVRRPVEGLPAQVRLDDAVSMNPAAPLSSASEVEVVVRLSLTGSVMAAPGDWEWRSQRLVPGTDITSLTAELAPPAAGSSAGPNANTTTNG